MKAISFLGTEHLRAQIYRVLAILLGISFGIASSGSEQMPRALGQADPDALDGGVGFEDDRQTEGQQGGAGYMPYALT